MRDFVALERCLGACILGLLVSEGSELGGCEVGMPDAKDVNRFCVIKFWNNLNNDQRKALLDLANDPSITIKPADKGGSIVIMNTDDYIKSCLNSLSNTNFYEQLPTDLNPKYRTDHDQKIDDLLSSNIINEFEASKWETCISP